MPVSITMTDVGGVPLDGGGLPLGGGGLPLPGGAAAAAAPALAADGAAEAPGMLLGSTKMGVSGDAAAPATKAARRASLMIELRIRESLVWMSSDGSEVLRARWIMSDVNCNRPRPLKDCGQTTVQSLLWRTSQTKGSKSNERPRRQRAREGTKKL